MSRGWGALGLVMQPPEKYKRKVKKMTEINKANGLDASWAGQTFSNNGVKLSDLKESNKLLFDFFKNKGLDESSYVYASDVEKLKEEFDNGNGKFSKRELKKMGLDIKRSDVKAINRTLQAIQESELAEDGAYPVKVDENTTDFYTKNNVRAMSVKQNGANTQITEYDETGEKVLKITRDMKGLGRVVDDFTEPGKQVTTYEGDLLLSKTGGIIQEEVSNENGIPTKILTYVNGDKKVYHQSPVNNEWIEEKTKVSTETTAPSEETPKTEPEEEVVDIELPKFKEVFEKSGKKATIDETGSSQKLTRNNTWNTDVVIPKRANYDGNGVPKEIAIALPDDYGSKGADGVAQKRYQTLKLIDPENNIYSDKAGIRKFQMNIADDGITLKQVNYENGKIAELSAKDSEKVKAFLDQNVKTVEKEVDKNYHKEHKSPFVRSDMNRDATQLIKLGNKENAEALVGRLADRNTAWQTYLQAGTENGSLTGSNGLLEKMYDAGNIKSKDGKSSVAYKTYDSIKPAIDGLMAAIPDNKTTRNSAEYKEIKALVKELSESKGTMPHDKVRDLDTAFMKLAKKNMVNPQGTNYANNSYLRSANNAVLIQPDYANSMWRSDAKFTLGGKNYYFYRDDLLWDKCYDFQDIVGNNKLITNDSTANNRKGEISFNADKLDANESYYFQRFGGREIPVIIENGVAYIEDPKVVTKDKNGKAVPKRIPLNEILNGRVPMPD